MNDTDFRVVSCCILCGAPIYGPAISIINSYGAGCIMVNMTCECKEFLQDKLRAEAEKLRAEAVRMGGFPS